MVPSINHGDQNGMETMEEMQEGNTDKDMTGFMPN